MGQIRAQQVLIGKQTAFGTSVAGTAKLMNVTTATFDPAPKITIHDEKRGTLFPGSLTTIDSYEGTASIEQIATYEDICYMLDSLFAIATPSGAGPYVRAYSNVSTKAAAPASTRLNTLWLLDNDSGTNRSYYLQDALLSKFTLSGNSGEVVTMKTEWMGTKVVYGDSPASLADRTVTVIHNNVLTFYEGATATAYASLGALSTCAHTFTLEITPSRKMLQCIGQSFAADYLEDPWEGTFSAQLSWSKALDQTAGLVLTSPTSLQQQNWRLKATTGATRIAQFDISTALVKAPTLFDDKDGITTVSIEGRGTPDATLGTWLAASVTNSVSALV